MNEMDLLARFRDDVPAGVSAAAVRRFEAGISGTPTDATVTQLPGAAPLRVRRPRWRLAAAGLAAAGIAAVATTLTLTATSGSRPAPLPQLTVTQLAYRAATAAVSQPAVAPGQWVYRSLYSPAAGPFNQKGTVLYWATADNRTNAFYVRHRLVVGPWSSWAPIGCAKPKPKPHLVPCTPATQRYLKFPLSYTFLRYSQLGSLPASPAKLIAALAAANPKGYIYDQVRSSGEFVMPGAYLRTRSFRAFNVISFLLASYVLPPRLTAELYRALGKLPGIGVYQDVVDVAGQHGIAFVLRGPAHSQWAQDIILNRSTYQFMAFGNQRSGSALVRQAFVSGPGALPAQ
jgi:hypothetical protein